MERTEVNSKRNYSIRKAEELIKQHGSVNGAEVKIAWKTDEPGVRHVIVGLVPAFIQLKNDLGGTFAAPFSNLCF